MQPLITKYCVHFDMKYPVGKSVRLGLCQGLEVVGKFSFEGYMSAAFIQSLQENMTT